MAGKFGKGKVDKIDAVSQIISSYVRVTPISATEYEGKTVRYTNSGGKVTTEVIVDVYNRYGAINSVRIGHPTTVDTMV